MIADDGIVTLAGSDVDSMRQALKVVKCITEKAEVGKVYRGIVKPLADCGAFVEILPGTDGLVHISQLSDDHVDRVRDVCREGDELLVKVMDVDRQGKIRLSHIEALADAEELKRAG